MFDRILIANRGEIACRVIRTARRMGVATVAVYSDADAGALHVEMADEAVRIGPAPVSESYLRGDAIIQAALDTGAQAIHPGYGFLSENAAFAQAVAKAGLTFIGPSADAIRAMGLKDGAKALMEKANVPVVPGYHDADQSPELLADEAEKIGFPVLIKAVAGGGGKGMRRVDDAGAFHANLKSAKREAESAFGNADVLIEKFVANPRHIEIQVFGDGERAVHLFERDCSLQRRHQKVIEEAPAPGMTPELRTEMGAAAVRAAEAIGYSGAGTVEFIVDASNGLKSDGFYFMEMNTRLQVEHPVTEAITGIDLVEWQLRVAAGEGLPAAQGDLSMNGHAFEARIYAEDAGAGFLPATGRLECLEFPENARADSGVRAGDEITPFYDPMIAKLIVHAPGRSRALTALSRALKETKVAGTVTNLAFLARLADHELVRSGDVDTGLIDRDLAALTMVAPPADDIWAVAAAFASVPSDQMAGFALWGSGRQFVDLAYEGELKSVGLTWASRDTCTAQVQGAEIEVEFLGDSVRVAGRKLKISAHLGLHSVTLFADRTWVFTLPDPLDRSSDTGVGGNAVLAPMPGLVKVVNVAVGASVRQGDVLAVIEAMKMEHSLQATRDGIVAEMRVVEGAQVASGDVLIALEPEP
jgi:3-methylcrotonyl-CoA carboxylase alpha subunit